jgi:hypothetical protein
MQNDSPPYAELDPGIVAAVRFLNAHGYRTTDSGDGVSKEAGDETIPFPHVAVRAIPSGVVTVSDQIALLPWDTIDLGPPTMIEASYSAIDRVALVMVGWP